MFAATGLLALALVPQDAAGPRFVTSRPDPLALPLPAEDEAFTFVILGDRAGGPPESLDVLARAVDEVNLLAPDLVLTVGDLVEGYGDEPEWLERMQECKDVLARLEVPWFPVAGDHDVSWRGEGEPPPHGLEPLYERHFGPLWYAFRHENAWFVVLYSGEGDPAIAAEAPAGAGHGRTSPEQLAWLEETLARAADADHVLVFLHHPRWLGPDAEDWERVHAVLARAGNVKAVFAGHLHRMRYDGARDGIERFTLATVGGAQSGAAPAAGYVHEYHLVTVRRDRVSVAALPVGALLDVRAITGEVSDAAGALAGELAPRIVELPSFHAERGADGDVVLELANPVDAPVEVTLAPELADARWSLAPEEARLELAPGELRSLRFRLARPGGGLDAAFALPALRVSATLLAATRFPVPARVVPLRVRPAALPAPAPPPDERVLVLDGKAGLARVPAAALALPDGPFTIEAWAHASDLRPRQGLLAKGPDAEYALLVDGGVPAFRARLGDAVVEARALTPMLELRRWHHVAGVYDGAEVALYVDGKRIAASPASGARATSASPLLVGADEDAAGRPAAFFPGLVDEVRVSSVARYAGERFEPARRHEADEATVLLLHFDGPVAAWAFDASPAAAHALLEGGARVAPPP